MADTSTTPEQKRSQLLQADAAMASLQDELEKRHDNNLAMIQGTFDALHGSRRANARTSAASRG